MSEGLFLGFDFGYKRIGVAVGERITATARPLCILVAKEGKPHWPEIKKIIDDWQPQALIVGLPTSIADEDLYVTEPAKRFAQQLEIKFRLPVHLVDERLTTKEARSQLFQKGGYRKLKSTAIDSIAACLILEQWLHIQK